MFEFRQPLRYEYANWNKRTEGSRTLRRVMAKFSVHDSAIPASTWGSAYTGAEDRPLTRDEELVRDCIGNISMSVHRANIILDNMDDSRPFTTRVEFIERLAAIVALHPQEARRVAKGANRPLFQILHSAAAWQRVEWYFTNICTRYLYPHPD